jgi:anti-sigma factor RsiW
MTECTDTAIKEMLPELMHRTLPADAVARVEAHLVTCGDCRNELQALRTVMAAAVFAPAIDAERIARQIPPYQRIAPRAPQPARSRLVSWLAAASLAITVVGVGSVLVSRDDGAVAPTSVVQHSHELALAADVEGLSDGNLVQLMNEMTAFDGLPATESDPVISVDSGYNTQQDSQ